MGSVLYKLGGLAVRRRWAFVGVWLALFVALGIGATTLSGPTSDALSIPGTESQQAIDLLTKQFPGTGGAAARVVVAAPPGHRLDESQYRGIGEQALAEVAKAPQVVSVTGFAQATLSKDGRIAFGDIQYAVTVDKVSAQAKAALERIAGEVRQAGLQVEFSGGVIATTNQAGASAELYGVLIAFGVLAFTFGALVAAGMPLLTAFLGVGAGLFGIQTLSGFVGLTSTAPALASMLGLAVGIDYTLFILSRYRQNLARGLSVPESVALATATAGGAVLFAGLTVVIALVGLSVVGIPFLTTMGLAAAGTVSLIVLLALTFVPAVLALLGRRVNAGRLPVPAARAPQRGEGRWGAAWARLVTRRPGWTVLVSVGLVAVVALPVLDMRLGLPDDSTRSTSTTERRAYDLLSEGFGPGFNGPLTLVVATPGRSDVVKIAGQGVADLRAAKGVAAVSAPIANRAGDVAIVLVTPSTSPASAETKALVGRIRAAAAQAGKGTDVRAYVTGGTAVNIDISDKLSSALPRFIVLIVGLALVLLLLVFRSVLVPIKAVVGFLLSLAGSLGATVWVFQQGHLGGLFGVDGTGPIISFLPVLVVGILFGLAMDYEVFLVSRIREDYLHRRDPRGAIVSGMTNSARVVTAAGLIMMAVFASFIFGGDSVISSIGLALAVGVGIDAFVVRMTLVPAVLALLGHRAWKLPSWLDRLLPDLDLEGTRLDAAHALPAAPAKVRQPA